VSAAWASSSISLIQWWRPATLSSTRAVASRASTIIDAAYAVYDSLPLDAPDEWGDLVSFRDDAGSS
jgi:hypothetical protein